MSIQAIKKHNAVNNGLIKDTFGDHVFMIFLYVVLTIVMLLILLPLIYVVSASFSDPQAVISGEVWLLPVRPTIKGYTAVFKNPKIMIGFANSIFYTIVATIVNLIMTMLCAYPLSRKEFKGRNILSAIFVFTMYFSGGLMPTYLVVNALGLIDTRAVMIVPVALSVFNVIICRTYITSTVPDVLYEAACLDGCTPIQFLIYVILPLSAAILAVLTLYYGVGHWNTYFNAMIYLKTESKFPLQIFLREILVQNTIDPTMVQDVKAIEAKRGLTDLLKYSLIVVASVPVLCIYPFVQKYFVAGVMVGAVKG